MSKKPKPRLYKRGLDQTREPGTPAFEIAQIYPQLMDIAMPELFVSRVRGVLEPMVESGAISAEDFQRIMTNLQRCIESPGRWQNPITALRDYMTRGFLLAAAGLRVIGVRS